MATTTVPMEPQPILVSNGIDPDWWVWNKTGEWIVEPTCPKSGAVWRADLNPMDSGAAGIVDDAPHRPGDRIPLRDEWEVIAMITDMKQPRTTRAYVVYGGGDLWSADPVPIVVDKETAAEWEYDVRGDQTRKWRPASEMPDWAVRNWGTVVSCVPVRVEGVWCWVTEVGE